MDDPSGEHFINCDDGIPPSAEFSDVVAHCLMSMEELRRHCQEAASSTATVTAAANVGMELEHVLGFLSQIQALMPALDQLSRWTADRANDASVEADLFRHVQTKAIWTAHLALQTSFQFTEPFLDVDEETTRGANQTVLLRCQRQQQQPNGIQNVDEILREYQGAVAQLVEFCLVLVGNGPKQQQPQQSKLPTLDDIVKEYVAFQRQTLRSRVKPTIAKLVHERKRGFDTTRMATITTTDPEIQVYRHDDEDEDEENNDDGEIQQQHLSATRIPPRHHQKYHARALAVILGQAAALLNPLQAWQVHLPAALPLNDSQGQLDPIALALSRMCAQAIQVLDEQAQQLTSTVSDWFWQDYKEPMEDFMQKSADLALSSSSSSSSSNNNNNKQDLGMLDGLVEEMALASLLVAQYQTLMAEDDGLGEDGDKNRQSSVLDQLLGEWTWKYAALERYLAVQQWQMALSIAQPVQIVMETNIYVPSVVEDAQYLSTRALERAASTRSLQAIGTVAHAIAHDVWSNNSTDTADTPHIMVRGVQQALLEERGCRLEPDEDATEKKSTAAAAASPQSKGNATSFTMALLDALDEDLDGAPAAPKKNQPHPPVTTAAGKSPPRSGAAPSSGNFLAALTTLSGGGGGGGGGSSGSHSMRLLQMHARFCALNGIHAAASACRSLVDYLDCLLPEEEEEEQYDDKSIKQPATEPGSEDNPATNHNHITSSDKHKDSKAKAMIQLAREDLFRYASTYQEMLARKVIETINEYCTVSGDSLSPVLSGHGLLLDHIATFVANEDYEVSNAAALQKLENDERLEAQLVAPLKVYIFLQQLSARCSFHVLVTLAEHLVDRLVHVILRVLWDSSQDDPKRFTDWGSLLLAKEVRLIQQYMTECLAPSAAAASATMSLETLTSVGFAGKWERLTQVVQILQMEMPAEWLMYSAGSVLTPDEVQQTMQLRVDFAMDAIAAVTTQIGNTR